MLRLLTFSICLASMAAAQQFEVAAINLHADQVRMVGVTISGTRVNVSAMSVSNLVEFAYNLKIYQVLGGPAWVTDDRWDIAAKGEGDHVLTRDEVRMMMQPLLAERFHVVVHRETREMPVYNLEVAKGGAKLKESAPDARGMLRMGGGKGTRIVTTAGDMEQLAGQLGVCVDHPVFNRTGLTGKYDYRLEFAPENSAAAEVVELPSIFAALQEQLGLKLETSKGNIEVMVIDRAEKPTAN